MIAFADSSMLPDLTNIWQQSFGDSPEYIQMFLDWNFSRIKTVVYLVASKPVSVAYLLPITYIEAGGSEQPCLYLYAAATLPEYRGRGYFGEILKYIHLHIKEPVLLVPGEPSLVDYYKGQGFRVWLQEKILPKELMLPKAAEGDVEVQDITPEQYYVLRENFLSQTDHIRWSKSFIQYICRENEYCSGEIKLVNWQEQQFLAMYRREKEKVQILELLSQEQAETYLQPTVMASSKWKVPEAQGYFNLIMG